MLAPLTAGTDLQLQAALGALQQEVAAQVRVARAPVRDAVSSVGAALSVGVPRVALPELALPQFVLPEQTRAALVALTHRDLQPPMAGQAGAGDADGAAVGGVRGT